jgi:guanylate kinase
MCSVENDKMEETRFDKFLEKLGDAAQIDSIRTRLLNANPIIESVETLQNVVRNRTVESATGLLERSLNLNELDASALAGLLVASRGQNI